MGLNKGQTNSGSFKKGMTPWIKGRTHSIESIIKMSNSLKGRVSPNKGRKASEETRRKLSESHKGQIPVWKGKSLSEKRKKKLSNYWKEKYKNGYINPLKGKRMSKEIKEKMKLGIKLSGGRKTKGKKLEEIYGKAVARDMFLKMSIKRKGKKLHKNALNAIFKIYKKRKGKTYEEIYGEERAKIIKNKIKEYYKNPRIKERCRNKLLNKTMELALNWKGGKSLEPYDKNFNNKFKRLIRKRDNQICMMCGIHREKLKSALHVHHINYNKLLTIPQNCISLCILCHLKTNSNREHWTKFFQSILSEKYNYQYSENKELILNV